MMDKQAYASAKCPFYKYEKTCDIKCETWKEEMGLTINFKDLSQRARFSRKYCRKDYKLCKFYRLTLLEFEKKEFFNYGD